MGGILNLWAYIDFAVVYRLCGRITDKYLQMKHFVVIFCFAFAWFALLASFMTHSLGTWQRSRQTSHRASKCKRCPGNWAWIVEKCDHWQTCGDAHRWKGAANCRKNCKQNCFNYNNEKIFFIFVLNSLGNWSNTKIFGYISQITWKKPQIISSYTQTKRILYIQFSTL